MSHLLIYDADLSGHHQDYLDAVLAYVEAHSELSNGVTKVSFMLPSGYWQAGREKRSTQFANRLDIEAQSLERRNALSPRRRAIFEVEMLIRTVKEHQVDELFLMNIDYFQVALASPLARSLACRISGIQLQPYTRSEIVARGFPFSITLLFRALRKRLRLEQMIRNVDVSRLCIPADTTAVDLLNRRHSAQLSAIMLPEPYLGAGSASGASDSVVLPDVYERYSLNSNCRIILAFGNIITRKNVENVIRALAIMEPENLKDTVLLVVGKASETYQARLRSMIQADRSLEAHVRFDFEFVDDALMQALFHESAIIAMPYFKTYQSSGILFKAIEFGKPVVSANQGLVSELVRQYSLGEAVKASSVREISAAMTGLLETWTPSPKVQALIDIHTASNHAAVVLNQKS